LSNLKYLNQTTTEVNHIDTDQVKSKKRVADHGEVFTSEREVNTMLDLVKQETERIESRFLEPACGNGNFLIEVLKRKLEVVGGRYKNSQLEWERYAVTAVSSIYGVDILQDNVAECQERLLAIFDDIYTKLFKNEANDACKNTIRFILSKNILWGDALSLTTPDEDARPIVFSEWSPMNGSLMKRRDFMLAFLLSQEKKTGLQMSMFSDGKDDRYIPEPIIEFPPTHFLKLHEAERLDLTTLKELSNLKSNKPKPNDITNQL
jgi:hypothetical protein